MHWVAINGLQQNPAGYLSQMGIAATGQGYLVTDAMVSGLKNRLGLQTGDRVIAVNGQNVGQNPSQDAQLLRQVQRMGQLSKFKSNAANKWSPSDNHFNLIKSHISFVFAIIVWKNKPT